MKEEVQGVLDRIRPLLRADGGDVELVDVSADGIVKVRLTGACAGCPMSQMTLTEFCLFKGAIISPSQHI